MDNYHSLITKILNEGSKREDRTGVGTLSLFGEQLKFDLAIGFPAITTKKLAWKSVASELLWFIQGSGDEKKLKEILHGDPDSDKKTIWTDNVNADYWVNRRRKRHTHDLGRIYGVQWRTWRAPVFGINKMGIRHIDQLQNLVNGIKEDPYGRRHIITAWNPGEIELMALPPCHCFAQFYVSNGKLSCQMYQRSADIFLGVPFNIASYALFTHMIAQSCGLDVGNLIITFGDVHLYSNHIEQAKELITREPFAFPKLLLNPSVTDVTKFTMNDIELLAYESHDAITAPMAV
jgi:thymidylate synthase